MFPANLLVLSHMRWFGDAILHNTGNMQSRLTQEPFRTFAFRCDKFWPHLVTWQGLSVRLQCRSGLGMASHGGKSWWQVMAFPSLSRHRMQGWNSCHGAGPASRLRTLNPAGHDRFHMNGTPTMKRGRVRVRRAAQPPAAWLRPLRNFRGFTGVLKWHSACRRSAAAIPAPESAWPIPFP